jgi:hypothetical protein
VIDVPCVGGLDGNLQIRTGKRGRVAAGGGAPLLDPILQIRQLYA